VRRLVLVGSAAVALLLTGCSNNDAPGADLEGASPATVRTARCADWNDMAPADRDRLVLGMRDFFGGVVDQPGMRGQVLPADKAERVFDGFCKQPFAQQFVLYRLYGDAAAFTPAKVKASVRE
jgi:hypothetical protein